MIKLMGTVSALIFCTSLFAANADFDYTNSDDVDYSCAIKAESIVDALTVTKGDANVMKFAVNVNPSTCSIEGIFPVQVFWELGKKVKNGVIPCQGLSGMERKYFGYSTSDIQKLSPSSIRMNLEIVKKASDVITPQIIIDVNKVDGKCLPTVTFDINGQEVEVDTLAVKMGLFSVKQIKLISDGVVIYKE